MVTREDDAAELLLVVALPNEVAVQNVQPALACPDLFPQVCRGKTVGVWCIAGPTAVRATVEDTNLDFDDGEFAVDDGVIINHSTGIDLDLIPEAADYRARWNPEAAIVLVLPERDLALNTRLLPRLPRATVVGLAPPWSTLV